MSGFDQFILYAGVLTVAGAVAMSLVGGYANLVEDISYRLHRHARSTRERHEKRRLVIEERWVRELER